MARKIRVEAQERPAEAPRTQAQSILRAEYVNPMPLRTKAVLIVEPLIMVLLAAYLIYTEQIALVLLAVFLAIGPITAFLQDRKIRPTKVEIDNNGVTPHFGSRMDTSIPWSIVVLIPRRRSPDGKLGGILVQEGRRMPYMVSNEIFEALADGYRKRNGKEPWGASAGP